MALAVQNCGICRKGFSQGEKVAVTHCDHKAHLHCFSRRQDLRLVTRRTSKLFCFHKAKTNKDCCEYSIHRTGKGYPKPFFKEKKSLKEEDLLKKVTVITFSQTPAFSDNSDQNQHEDPASQDLTSPFAVPANLKAVIAVSLITTAAFISFFVFQSLFAPFGVVVAGCLSTSLLYRKIDAFVA